MRIVQINHFSYKAAGNIMMNLHGALTAKGVDSYVVWGRGRKAENDHEYYMDDPLGVNIHALYTRVTDRAGFASKRATKLLVKWLEEIKPDIIHLHCMHGYYINLEILFDFIRENNTKVIWTQHDCWAFTGHCAYFDMVGCEKWINGCHNCEQLKTYPTSFRDASKKNWQDKKKMFSGLDIQIVTPCNWLKELVQKSFLQEYPIEVIYNGIDLNVFKRSKRVFRSGKSFENKFIILGVASEWTERKGLKDFIALDEMIDHDKYQIIIVGLSKEQINKTPKNIFAIERTENVQGLVDIYSSADVFLNPTYEDNFPTTNLESIACGTPVITYRTGGAPECINEGINGYVVELGDLDTVKQIVDKFILKDNVDEDRSLFSKEIMIRKYEELYYGKDPKSGTSISEEYN